MSTICRCAVIGFSFLAISAGVAHAASAPLPINNLASFAEWEAFLTKSESQLNDLPVFECAKIDFKNPPIKNGSVIYGFKDASFGFVVSGTQVIARVDALPAVDGAAKTCPGK